jgi:hypothetical protein
MASKKRKKDQCKAYKTSGMRDTNKERKARAHAKRVARKTEKMARRQSRIYSGRLKPTSADVRHAERSDNQEARVG